MEYMEYTEYTEYTEYMEYMEYTEYTETRRRRGMPEREGSDQRAGVTAAGRRGQLPLCRAICYTFVV